MIGTATRKTVLTVDAYADATAAWTPAGRCCNDAGLTEAPRSLGTGYPCNAVASRPPITLAKIAPKIAAPNEPPMDRKNVAPAVATPSSS